MGIISLFLIVGAVNLWVLFLFLVLWEWHELVGIISLFLFLIVGVVNLWVLFLFLFFLL